MQVVIGVILAPPVAWGIHHLPSVKPAIVNLFGILYTIRSLALFVLLPPLLYTQILDPINVVVALSIGSFALLVCTVCDGLNSVSADTRQSAAALGYKPAQQFFQNDPPLAVPVIRYGLCVAVVFKVRIVSVAALIGTPQLGSLFTLVLPAAISDSHHRWDRGQHHSGAAAVYAGGLRHSSTQQLATSERIIMLQDSLSIRCIPQIRGAPTALAVAIAQLSTASQARCDRITNTHLSGLPAFLISPDSGYSGMMIPPYVAAALAGDNRSLAGPVSIHTVSTCAGQEDHVSMWRLPPHAKRFRR